MSLLGRHVLSINQFNRAELEALLAVARRLEPVAQRRQHCTVLAGAVMANLFFEASTRTRLSFHTAFARLGGAVCDSTGFSFSSLSKGESLADTARVIAGYADVIVTGGSEAAVNESGIGGFNALHALSTRNDEYKTASRPYDVTRDGFVLGEGAGALILEEYEHAKARGAKIYCELAGGGLSADAYHLTAPHPEGVGAKAVMLNCLADAKVSLEEVDAINLHGTSTPQGDIAETKAVREAFGEHAYKINLNSTKSMTGHLLGAAGAIEAVFALKAVEEDIVPPTINHASDDEDPEIDYKLNFTFNEAQRRPVRAALSNTFGFGGHNASVIFKKFAK